MFALSILAALSLAWADETVLKMEIRHHVMEPAALSVPAGQEFWLEVKNDDNTSEELESRALKFEKIVAPKRTVRVKIHALTAGAYDLFGDFHSDTCTATLTAK